MSKKACGKFVPPNISKRDADYTQAIITLSPQQTEKREEKGHEAAPLAGRSPKHDTHRQRSLPCATYNTRRHVAKPSKQREGMIHQTTARRVARRSMKGFTCSPQHAMTLRSVDRYKAQPLKSASRTTNSRSGASKQKHTYTVLASVSYLSFP